MLLTRAEQVIPPSSQCCSQVAFFPPAASLTADPGTSVIDLLDLAYPLWAIFLSYVGKDIHVLIQSVLVFPFV